MKIIDERQKCDTLGEMQTKAKTEKNKDEKSYCERVKAKWFCCALSCVFST